ncbi:MAG: transglutaminase domain-containing protein, partial [Spirochaetales bacterium]|nr:transglutaminase domain-containing protein [Spirochaetales bacterium]
ALVSVALALAVAAWYRTAIPVLSIIDPVEVAPGQTVTLLGRNFGAHEGDVLFDGVPVMSSAIQLWTPEMIIVRVPQRISTSLVSVRTSYGISGSLAIGNQDSIPRRVAENDALRAMMTPVLQKVKPATQAERGGLLSIEGSYFGEPDNQSGILISSFALAGSRIDGAETQARQGSGFLFLPATDPHVEQWNDRLILLRLPETAETGSLQVRTRRGASEPYPLTVSTRRGHPLLGETSRYVITQSVSLQVSAAKPDGMVTFYFPAMPSLAYAALDEEEVMVPEGAALIRGDGWAAVSMNSSFATRGTQAIVLKRKLTVAELNVRVAIADLVSAPVEAAFLAPFLKADRYVPSDLDVIRSAAASIASKEKNPYRKVLKAVQWIGDAIAWSPDTGTTVFESAESALRQKRGGTRGYVLALTSLIRALGIPARPIAGALVLSDGRLFPHWWLEYYLQGIGWVPLDVALANGAQIPRFEAFQDRSRYLQGLDNRHIPLSIPGSRLPAAGNARDIRDRSFWSWLDADERVLGMSHTSQWALPRLEKEP